MELEPDNADEILADMKARKNRKTPKYDIIEWYGRDDWVDNFLVDFRIAGAGIACRASIGACVCIYIYIYIYWNIIDIDSISWFFILL